jgi:hypothetical protein
VPFANQDFGGGGYTSRTSIATSAASLQGMSGNRFGATDPNSTYTAYTATLVASLQARLQSSELEHKQAALQVRSAAVESEAPLEPVVPSRCPRPVTYVVACLLTLHHRCKMNV